MKLNTSTVQSSPVPAAMTSWSVQAALAIVVPNHLNSWIQECRAVHDSAYDRWPPHINLLFPFIEESDFGGQILRLNYVVGSLPAFNIKLHTTGFFKHGPRKWVLILKPEESIPGSLERLQQAVYDLYPQCSKQREVGGGKFVPHVTLGQFETQAAMESKMAELASKPAVEFKLEFISMLGRTKTGPFDLKQTINLGTASLPSSGSDEFGSLFSSGTIPVPPIPVTNTKQTAKKTDSRPERRSALHRSSGTRSASKQTQEEDDFGFGLFGGDETVPVPEPVTKSAPKRAASKRAPPASKKPLISEEPEQEMFGLFDSDATTSAASSSSPSTTTSTKRTSITKKPEGGAFKSSYYQNKTSPLTSKEKTSISKTPKSPSSTLSSEKSTKAPTSGIKSPASKYSIAIEPPKVPQFNTFATTMVATPPSVPPMMTSTLTPPAAYSPSVSLGTGSGLGGNTVTPGSGSTSLSSFSPSKPPAAIVLSSPKTDVKPKVSSYYSGGKKATIGRKTDSAASSAFSSVDLSYEASAISISAEFEKPDPNPPEPVRKVVATKVKEPAALERDAMEIAERVLQWLITSEAIKRPKTRAKLSNAIAKMCTTTTKGMTATEALDALISGGNVAVERGSQIRILKKGTKDLQRYNMTLNQSLNFQTEREAALDRCINWVMDPDNQPKSKAALLNTIRQLVQVKKLIPPSTIVQYLIENGHITVLQDEKGAEFLEYLL